MQINPKRHDRVNKIVISYEIDLFSEFLRKSTISLSTGDMTLVGVAYGQENYKREPFSANFDHSAAG